MTKILIADDHPVTRAGLRGLLASEPSFEVVGETGDGLKVVDLVEKLAPDVLTLDLMMPGLNGIEACRQVVHHFPKVKVLVLSMHTADTQVIEALRAGAMGYLVKDAALDDLVRAIHTVASGRRFLSPQFVDRAARAWMVEAEPALEDPFQTLTERERQVFQLAAEGFGNIDVGRRLFISPRTVEIHRANVLRKLKLASQTDLVRYALRRGVISLEG